MSAPCSSCCPICLRGGPAEPSPSDVYADLDRFLPAGTITWALLSDDWKCGHNHARDRWHQYPGRNSLSCMLAQEDTETADLLDFLAFHRFIATTCCIDRASSTLVVRVYLIPYDLPNVQGRLRTRDEATILGPGRRALQQVLPKIIQDENLWAGLRSADPNPQPFFFADMDNRTLAEIYSDLPSPPNIVGFNQIPHLKSQLHPYQRRSVASMINREINPPCTPDPLYLPIVGINGQIFYIQPATMEVLRDCPKVAQAPGGILCEELGTGKTIMTLSLILSTLDQLPSPPEDVWDPRPIFTPLSLRHFPFVEAVAMRKRLRARRAKDKEQAESLEDCDQVPSLVELLLHYCRVHPESIDLHKPETHELLERPGLLDKLLSNTPFYYQFDSPERSPRSPRNKVKVVPKKIYLSSATLVVVPANLLRQWETEIWKHCVADLRVLVLRSTTELPSVSALASRYDIIVMTYSRFATEGRKFKTSDSPLPHVCQCPPHPDSRVPDCCCESAASPLSQIRWKRLVIDEGHVAGSPSTDSVAFAESLNVECRWIVTGTPTTNLLGLHFGRGSEPTQEHSENPPLQAGDPNPNSETSVVRIWNKQDREDLRKLSVMLSRFLKVPRFAADTRLFTSHLANALTDKSGPRPGAIRALTQVMSSVMIRHRIEDVERDVLLPRLTHDTIYLDLDPYGAKTYNVMQANIAINAVDSERVDQDYLFHRRNATKLLQLIDNLSQALFWHCDDDCFHVDETLRDGEKFVQHALERNTSAEDMQLLRSSIALVEDTASDIVWRRLQGRPFIYHRVRDMQQSAYEAWTSLGDAAMLSSECLLPSDRLAKFRNFLVAHPLASTQNIVATGHEVNYDDALLDARQHKTSKGSKDKEDISNGSLKELEKLKSVPAGSTEKLREMQEALHLEKERLRLHVDEDVDIDAVSDPKPHQTASEKPTVSESLILLSGQPSARVRLGNSTSSKLNHILNEVLKHSANEKFLIFSSSPLTLAFVGEALELIGVKFLSYMSTIPAEHRDHAVLTFETSPTFRVFLMELKHGARGLNLVTASRVIFCEPVWQADVETQAIKRVHRIGQSRPVSVQTLAIRGTYEEVVVTRRQALKARTSNTKQSSMTDDRTIRDFIANPTFLRASTCVTLDIPLFKLPEPQESSHNSPEEQQPALPSLLKNAYAVPTKAAHEHGQPPWKKIRMVRFADEVVS
ncbi:hypothetical protein CERSUDRAFT_152945 [Gelatoporia subvermispora B]|uniref:Helicase ATP-binding domain-containing protein n=1 Tax=Ceriporiopsis subvermispora (strain B) TaxID=914234 RepID=M2PP35_CERS8|nr:hypothetical protein CERSUDRAFT_152945 [Gelatoporia subvermispora B]